MRSQYIIYISNCNKYMPNGYLFSGIKHFTNLPNEIIKNTYLNDIKK